MSLKGKVAIITGGSKGIGRAVSLKLASLGASVVINYGRDSAAAEELVSKIGAEQALAVQADAGSVVGVQDLVKQTVAKFGKVDILMPNAGVMPMRDLEHTTEHDFDSIFNLNAAAPHMAPGSHIILVSTSLTAASNIAPEYLPYVTSKGAIDQMTRVLGKDLGRKGIRVNAIAPGPTSTELFLKGKSEQLIKTIASGNPFNKLGEPEEIADVVAFLAGEDSRWVSGQIVKVNGSMT